MGQKIYQLDDQQKDKRKTDYTGPTYAAGIILLSFDRNGDLQVHLVESAPTGRLTHFQPVGLPLGKEKEEDGGNYFKTARREFAEETKIYPRIKLHHGFTLNRAKDGCPGEQFPNHILYGWDDGSIEFSGPVLINPTAEEINSNKDALKISTKPEIVWSKPVDFFTALNLPLKAQHRLFLTEFYYQLKAGEIHGYEEEVGRYMARRKFDFLTSYEAFRRPTEVEKENGPMQFVENNFLVIVVKDGCSHVLDPSSSHRLDFLTPSNGSDTRALVWFKYEGKKYNPREQLLLKV